VINHTSRETGTVRMLRPKPRDIRMLIEFDPPDVRTVSFERNTMQEYHPKLQLVYVYDLGKHRALVDQFLLLGFASSARELQRSYQIKAVGEEQIDGQTVTRIELVPKSASAREHLSRAELWITAAGYPLRQKLYFTSGNDTEITYRNVRINTNLSVEAVRLQLPPGVKREYPQK